MPQNTPLQSPTLSAKNARRKAMMVLARAHIASAALDARVLLQHVLSVSHERLLADECLPLSPRQEAHYQELIDKRSRRQPVAQLIGQREFYGRVFTVSEHTLDPRADSETVIEAVLGRVKGYGLRVMGKEKSPITHNLKPITILDLGTGTGCLLLTLLRELDNAKGVGVDVSEEALKVAQGNAKNLGVAARVSLVHSSWAEKVEGEFDIIISNPPYIPTNDIAALAAEVREFEPHLALDGGADGLECYRAIMPQVKQLLAADGFAAFEIGSGQEKEVKQIVMSHGLRVMGVKDDLSGIARCIVIQHEISNA